MISSVGLRRRVALLDALCFGSVTIAACCIAEDVARLSESASGRESDYKPPLLRRQSAKDDQPSLRAVKIPGDVLELLPVHLGQVVPRSAAYRASLPSAKMQCVFK